MELNIFELNKNELIKRSFEQIPENIISTKNDIIRDPTISKQNAKIIKEQIPSQKQKISYEDILSKMGMFVSDGKLHLVNKKVVSFEQQMSQQVETNIPQNNYIYNKHFKNELQPQNAIIPPKTLQEYKNLLLKNYIENLRIKQIKSKKLLMPTSNINIATGNSNLNKLFSFSKK
jgi:hypothetical protein